MVSSASPEVAELGRLLLLTDRAQCEGRLVDVVAAAAGAGARTVVVREKDLPLDERRRLVDDLRQLVPVLLVADGLAAQFPAADGVHLSRSALAATGGASARHDGSVLGISCHDRGEVRDAAERGATYATLSPIFPTDSKPGYGPALGPGALGYAPLPVFALGGLDETRAAACLTAGAHGVAVMGAVMRSPSPERTVQRLLDALEVPVP